MFFNFVNQSTFFCLTFSEITPMNTLFSLPRFVLVCTFFLLTHGFTARSQEVRDLLLEGKNLVDVSVVKGDVNGYTKAIALFERILAVEPANNLALYYRSYSEMRLLMQGTEQSEAAKKVFAETASEHAEALVQHSPQSSDAMTVLAGVTMLRIDGMNAMTLAPKCTKLHEKALAADANNPRAYVIRGMYTMNTPSFFGGGADKALQHFAQAISLCEKQGLTAATQATKPQPTWGYLDALIWAGRCHAKMEQYPQAIAYYKKALAIAPEFTWVKQTLLPRAEQKMAATGIK